MKIQDFKKMVSVSPNAVILLEGRRGISEAEAFAARDPMAGGTGHTIRVCHQESVPVVFQTDWLEWM